MVCRPKVCKKKEERSVRDYLYVGRKFTRIPIVIRFYPSGVFPGVASIKVRHKGIRTLNKRLTSLHRVLLVY